ncbi:hypothetical protein MCO_00645 [Bartonella sp. DB5-6]|uniref:TIR domain-containing protein n=1 Tax=Bartonella sp. DB5-6 TaxID=1094755 RepID=UPI00026E92F5|nr:TIR domain-containing protein [Bartonella sp. DB5-6]EJF78461.1 hypothetical protein MCO_00645 [Bartonella sp. DB5-6]
MEYKGTFEDLKNMVCKAGYEIIEAKPLSHNSPEVYQIIILDAGSINWYGGSSGKIVFQSSGPLQENLKKALAKHLGKKSKTSSPKTSSNTSDKKVFVVHGHDAAALEQLELTLRRLGLEPYILQNTSGNGLTIIEALEKEICNPTRSTKFGIVLLTPDDMGYSKSDGPQKAQPRARQNVVLEMGMLISALSRKNVAILIKQDVAPPSDIAGIIYLPFKNHVKETVPKLVIRLMESGFTLDPAAISYAFN